MPKRSAGLLLHRGSGDALEVLLAHPGGPFWAKRDLGAWSIPKGEVDPGESDAEAALREFEEELGLPPALQSGLVPLGEAVQPNRKMVVAFAAAADLDPDAIAGATLTVAWPPRSGRTITVPEVDRVAWFGLEEARRRILPGQAVFLDRLRATLPAG